MSSFRFVAVPIFNVQVGDSILGMPRERAAAGAVAEGLNGVPTMSLKWLRQHGKPVRGVKAVLVRTGERTFLLDNESSQIVPADQWIVLVLDDTLQR